MITTSDKLAIARLSRLDPVDREARSIVGGPPSGSTEAEDADPDTRRKLSPLYGNAARRKLTVMFQRLLNPNDEPTVEAATTDDKDDADVAVGVTPIPPQKFPPY